MYPFLITHEPYLLARSGRKWGQSEFFAPQRRRHAACGQCEKLTLTPFSIRYPQVGLIGGVTGQAGRRVHPGRRRGDRPVAPARHWTSDTTLAVTGGCECMRQEPSPVPRRSAAGDRLAGPAIVRAAGALRAPAALPGRRGGSGRERAGAGGSGRERAGAGGSGRGRGKGQAAGRGGWRRWRNQPSRTKRRENQPAPSSFVATARRSPVGSQAGGSVSVPRSPKRSRRRRS